MSLLQRLPGLGVGGVAQQRSGDGDAGERRAQLVAAIGEQQPVGGDQFLDALGRAVEAFGQRRHLVAALDLDPRAEIVAELLDARFQPLQPAAEAAHHRVGADRDRERHQRQERRDPEGRVGPLVDLAGDQPAAVGQLQGEVRATRAAPPAGAGARRRRSAAAACRPWRSGRRSAGRGRDRSAACGAAPRAPFAARPPARPASGSRAPVSSAATSRYCGVRASSSASHHSSAAAPTNTASTTRIVR